MFDKAKNIKILDVFNKSEEHLHFENEQYLTHELQQMLKKVNSRLSNLSRVTSRSRSRLSKSTSSNSNSPHFGIALGGHSNHSKEE